MRRVLCSTGAFITRKNGRNFYLIRETAPRLECDGFEFLVYESWDGCIEEIERELTSSGLSFPVMHADKRVGELLSRGLPGDEAAAFSVFARNILTAQRIGANTLVLHLWGGAPSDHQFDRNLRAYPRLQAMAEHASLALATENVVCAEGSPIGRLKQIADAHPGARFTYDTKMGQFHRENGQLSTPEGAWLFAGGRVAHLHVNDYGGGYKDFNDLRVLPFGAGSVDFDAFFNVVYASGYAGDATVESTSVFDDGRVNVDQLNRCLREVRARLARLTSNA